MKQTTVLDVRPGQIAAGWAELGAGASWAFAGAVSFASVYFANAYALKAVDGRLRTFVLKGRIEFQVGGERWVLRQGDSLYFDSHIPHRGWSLGGAAKVLVVIYKSDPRK